MVCMSEAGLGCSSIKSKIGSVSVTPSVNVDPVFKIVLNVLYLD